MKKRAAYNLMTLLLVFGFHASLVAAQSGGPYDLSHNVIAFRRPTKHGRDVQSGRHYRTNGGGHCETLADPILSWRLLGVYCSDWSTDRCTSDDQRHDHVG